MNNKKDLYSELTEMHIMAFYDFISPFKWDGEAVTWECVHKRREAAIERYRNDTMFNYRVQQLVSNTMFIIERHCEPKND